MSQQTAALIPGRDEGLQTETACGTPIEDRLLTAEGRLFQSQKELVAAMVVAENSHEELRQMQLQLIDAERMETAGCLGMGVAHEIKNLLAVLGFGIDYLSKSPASADPGIQSTLNIMRDSVKRGMVIVRGLVDFSAPRQLEFKARDINAVIESSLLLSKHEFVANHIVIHRELGQGLPSVELDDYKMSQVFVNVFINAAHAMSHGGRIMLRTYVLPSESAKNFSPAGGARIVAQIDDTGHGIPPDKLEQVFEPFFTTKPPGKGNGLGLSVVRQVVTLHGGRIDIRNREGGGVSVTVTLPERQPEPATACELPCGTGLHELAGPRHSEGVYHP